jgi:Chlorophyll A-B binding protein
MKSVAVFACAFLGTSSVLAFMPRPHIVSSGSRLSMSDTPTESNIDSFAAESPLKAADGDLEIDFDSLAQESAATAFTPKTDISGMYVKDESVRKAPRQAKWFPMLLSPQALDGSFAGDVGFDPIGFAKDKQSLIRMREAEIKHARLAMLAAAGWPLSELWHKSFAETFGLDNILAAEGRAPSVLNGGLTNEWIVASGVFSLLVGAALEFKSFQMVRSLPTCLIDSVMFNDCS